MRKQYMAGLLLFGMLLPMASARADVSWSWSFAPNVINVTEPGNYGSVPVDLTVRTRPRMNHCG